MTDPTEKSPAADTAPWAVWERAGVFQERELSEVEPYEEKLSRLAGELAPHVGRVAAALEAGLSEAKEACGWRKRA